MKGPPKVMAKESVLVVDDEPEILDLCLRVLEKEGYQVWGAKHGREAVSLGKQHKFDLLLTDIHMPDITGLDVAQTIKRINPDITCVTMTGFGTMALAIEALNLGIDEFIAKPFGPDELLIAVSKALEKRRLERENVRLLALIPLFELNKTFMATVDVNELFHQVVHIARQETAADRASLFLLRRNQHNRDAFYKRVSSPSDSHSAAQQQLEAAVAKHVAKSRQSLTVASQGTTGELTTVIPTFPPQHAVQATPLLLKGQLIGVLIVIKEGADQAFAPSDSELLSVLSGQAAIAIENARLFEEIQCAYEDLKELDRLKSEFINIAAHELRTPLAILLGYAGILEEEIDDDLMEYVQTITNNGMRLNSIIDDLLDLRNLETGQIKLTMHIFSLSEAVDAAIGELQPLALDKDHMITLEIPEDMPDIKTDRRKFDLVILNLLSNAIKFTPAQGQIQIAVRQIDKSFEIAVIDNGVGIAPEEQERIFTRFYQSESSLTREHGGMGLGLSIARGMIEFLGGQLQVESEQGKGSKFTFTIPQI